MKVFVYAISKDEETFAKRWYESMKEADDIFVLDTGSKDKTVDILRDLGVNVKQVIIDSWRFDTARNMSLEMVPYEECICVCTDLDEVFEIGWRKKLESIIKDCDRVKYNYIWSFDKYGNPEVNFYQEKIITTDEITLKHYPDDKKSRSSYLPLLELAVKEEPDNDRNMHYLGREYMYYGRYEEAINTLKKHLNMESATWKAERCASLRFISRCYRYLKDYDNAIKYCLLSIAEFPYSREPYYELASSYYILNDYERCKHYLELSLLYKENAKVYINEPNCYNGTIEDILSICYFYTNDLVNALKYIEKSLKVDPNNERKLKNKELILDKLN